MDASHIMGVTCAHIGEFLRYNIKYINPRKANETTKQDSITRYAKKVIPCMNNVKENSINQKREYQSGEVRVSYLSKNRDNKINPGLYWVMFHNIYHMYIEIKILDKVESINKCNYSQPQDKHTTEYLLDDMTTVPIGIHDF